MERRPSARFRLRRTVSPQRAVTAPPKLRRAIWGVSGAGSQQLFDEQAARFQVQHDQTRRRTLLLRLENEQLHGDVAELKQKLTLLRNVIQVFRSKLATERGARSVLAARLLDRQAEELQFQQAIRLSDLRLETALVGAEAQREKEALVGLVAAIYRMVAGRGGVPAGLEVAAAMAPKQRRPSEMITSDEAPMAAQEEWHRFLNGKIVGQTLRNDEGLLIARAGDKISTEVIAAAEHDGALFELILEMQLPPLPPTEEE
jgi:hypothetical protein